MMRPEPVIPAKAGIQGWGGGVSRLLFPAPPLLDSRFRGNDDFRGVGGFCGPTNALGTGCQIRDMARDPRNRH